MGQRNEIFRKYKDDTGEAYYCPVKDVVDSHIVSEWELDNCVEATTAERYSGHLKTADHNTG
ncbi:MAG: hypothetical protein P8X85_11905 [Desulfobacterales bacterium]